jgi:hypothetical protein
MEGLFCSCSFLPVLGNHRTREWARLEEARKRDRLNRTEPVAGVSSTNARDGTRYFGLGGYFSKDFLTMSSSLPSILVGSLFSSLAIARQTRE